MRNSNAIVDQLKRQGEQRLVRLATQFLASERFVQLVQGSVQSALSAKGLLDRQLRQLLAAMNLPSTGDIRELHQRLDDLERLLADLQDRLAEVLDDRTAAATGSEAPPER